MLAHDLLTVPVIIDNDLGLGLADLGFAVPAVMFGAINVWFRRQVSIVAVPHIEERVQNTAHESGRFAVLRPCSVVMAMTVPCRPIAGSRWRGQEACTDHDSAGG